MPARNTQLVSVVVYEDAEGLWTLRLSFGGEWVTLTKPYASRTALLLAVGEMAQKLIWDASDEASDG